MKKIIQLLFLLFFQINFTNDLLYTENSINLKSSTIKNDLSLELVKVIRMLINFIIKNQYVLNAEKLNSQIIEEIIIRISEHENVRKIVLPIIENNILLENLQNQNENKKIIIEQVKETNSVISSLSIFFLSISAIFNNLIQLYENKKLVMSKTGKILFSVLGITSIFNLCSTYVGISLKEQDEELSKIIRLQKNDQSTANNFLCEMIVNELNIAVNNI